MQDASEKSCLRRSGASRTGHFEMNMTGAVRAASIRDSKCDSQRGHQYGVPRWEQKMPFVRRDKPPALCISIGLHAS